MKKKLTSKDHKSLGFHDSRIHGVYFDVCASEFKSEVVFDIDYIVRWPEKSGDGFLVAPALLVFEKVTDLLLHIDWGDSGLTGSVDGIFIVDIERGPVSRLGLVGDYYKWQLVLNDDGSHVRFGSSGYTLTFIDGPILSENQYLKREPR